MTDSTVVYLENSDGAPFKLCTKAHLFFFKKNGGKYITNTFCTRSLCYGYSDFI